MGSAAWRAITAFDPDLRVALRRAQDQTFAAGAYGAAHKLAGLFRSLGKEPPPLPPQPKASSIEEARALAGDSGTCSVLDVYDLGDRPAPGVAGPLLLATDSPTQEDIEAALPQLYRSLRRGEAGYLVCYDGGAPHEVWFVGMSFD